MARTKHEGKSPNDPDFESLVQRHYASLYRFALSLTHQDTDAADLTQQTFLVWATKGHQLQNPAKAKTWLFTTLHREFLQRQRRESRFPHCNLEAAAEELPPLTPDLLRQLEAAGAVELLATIDPVYRAPVTLFYLQEHSYLEIAEILEIPLGTVKSRIARGLAQMQKAFSIGPGRAKEASKQLP